MNWNPFKCADPVQDETIMDLLKRVTYLENRLAELDSKTFTHVSELQSKLEKEKTAYKRAYARDYYARKKANLPTLKQIEMQARVKAHKEQA
jgi:hypothetical protein